jgi:transcriptional regulator with XRE-family HTH domain
MCSIVQITFASKNIEIITLKQLKVKQFFTKNNFIFKNTLLMVQSNTKEQLNMSVLGDRIKLLRKEKNWNQSELAEKIDADSRQISRYEKGKVNPSVETLIKIAETFDVSFDYLLVEDSTRQPFQTDDKELLKYMKNIQVLASDDKKCLYHIIDAFLTRNKIKSFANEI